MTTYSESGYLSALEHRSSSTLLVEGVTDSRYMHRILRLVEMEDGTSAQRIVVDSAELFRADQPGAGARDKVQSVYGKTRHLSPRVACWIDREWDQVSFPPLEDQRPEHGEPSPHLFTTRGHSVENYAFTAESVLGFLLQYRPETCSSPLRSAITASMRAILNAAVAVSLAARESAVITKCRGLARRHHWIVADVAVVAFDATAWESDLRKRSVDPEVASDFIARARELDRTALSHSEDCLRWTAHGHLGYELVWSAVAALAHELGTDAVTVDAIERGLHDWKHGAGVEQWLLRIDRGTDTAPVGLQAWMRERCHMLAA